MREIKYHAYLDSEERTILLHSLVELKNQLIQQPSLKSQTHRRRANEIVSNHDHLLCVFNETSSKILTV